ncbi:hypothetical protein LINPERHAP1_LOCUS16850 [Linum perenne]
MCYAIYMLYVFQVTKRLELRVISTDVFNAVFCSRLDRSDREPVSSPAPINFGSILVRSRFNPDFPIKPLNP